MTMSSTPGWRVALGAFLLLASGAVPASADLVYLTSGRTLSVKAIAFDGDKATMTLRTGGEIVCDRVLVDRVAPDEVPWPEPESVPTDAATAAGVAAVVLPAKPPRFRRPTGRS